MAHQASRLPCCCHYRYGLGRTGEAAEAKLTPHENEEFHTRLFCLLARYQALGGHGYQAALSEHGFRVLQKRMETQFECFASPLNCHFGRYCSAFPDTDCVFGSLGSFFSFRPTSGSYEANPPFVPEFMSAMTEHMEALLKKAKGPLSFTVIIPAWKEIHAWDQLERSQPPPSFPRFCLCQIPSRERPSCSDDATHHSGLPPPPPRSGGSIVCALCEPPPSHRTSFGQQSSFLKGPPAACCCCYEVWRGFPNCCCPSPL